MLTQWGRSRMKKRKSLRKEKERSVCRPNPLLVPQPPPKRPRGLTEEVAARCLAQTQKAMQLVMNQQNTLTQIQADLQKAGQEIECQDGNLKYTVTAIGKLQGDVSNIAWQVPGSRSEANSSVKLLLTKQLTAVRHVVTALSHVAANTAETRLEIKTLREEAQTQSLNLVAALGKVTEAADRVQHKQSLLLQMMQMGLLFQGCGTATFSSKYASRSWRICSSYVGSGAAIYDSDYSSRSWRSCSVACDVSDASTATSTWRSGASQWATYPN
eukprot:s1071_g11.t1